MANLFPSILCVSALVALTVTAVAPVHAQTPGSAAAEEQRIRVREQDEDRARQLGAPRVTLDEALLATDSLALPEEASCFPLNQLSLQIADNVSPAVRLAGASSLRFDPFYFAQAYLDQYAGQCIGRQGVGLLMDRLNQAIRSRGYSTTQVGLGEQDLSTGTLVVTLVPGVIREIRFSDDSLYGTWRNAFPAEAGRLLNLRELEQGLEQMGRVYSQRLSLEILPASEAGESDVVIHAERSRNISLTTNVNNGGFRSTGQYEGGLNLRVENPLGLSDIFSIGLTRDLHRQGNSRSNSAHSLYYSVPAGFWTYSLSANDYAFSQRVAGSRENLVSNGQVRNLSLTAAYLFQRDETQRNTIQARLGRRWSRSFLNDTEIQVQRRNTSYLELAWLHTRYLGTAQLDVQLASRWGIRAAGAQDDFVRDNQAAPTFFYTIQTADVTLQAPFKVASQSLLYTTSVRAQTTRSPLFVRDQFTIGGQYTVRGFDGELTLASERGFYWRNDLALALGKSGQSVYLALDAGKVSGPSSGLLIGTTLAGAALGIKGSYRGLGYNLFVGHALYKPDGFASKKWPVNFSVSYQY